MPRIISFSGEVKQTSQSSHLQRLPLAAQPQINSIDLLVAGSKHILTYSNCQLQHECQTDVIQPDHIADP